MAVLAGGGSIDPTAWHVRVGRQGIYDRRGLLVAHELLFRGLSPTSSGLVGPASSVTSGRSSVTTAGDKATSQTIATTFGDFGISQLSGGLPLYLNLTRAFIVGDLPLPFGCDGVVLEILEDVVVDDEVLAGLRHLRSRGFQLALDDFVGEEGRIALLDEVDVVKVDVRAVPTSLDDVLELCRRHAPRARLLAEKIEHDDMLQTCLRAGFDLFQGYHFQRPVLLETARMSPSQVVCLRLLRTLVDAAATTSDIESIVAGDPGLSLRVLRSANSASVASHRKITSLRQAVVLLGPPALSAWVTLTLLGGLTPGNRGHLVTVLARATCCESLDRTLGGDTAHNATAYLAGMLSGIAEVMRADVGEIAAGAGMEAAMISALTDGTGVLGQVVHAVLAHEAGRPFTGLQRDLSEADISHAYLQAWSSALGRVSGILDA